MNEDEIERLRLRMESFWVEVTRLKSERNELRAVVEVLKEELQAEKQSTMESIGAWQIIAGEWAAKHHHLQTEVERLKDSVEFEKQIVEETVQESRRDCEFFSNKAEKLEAEVERLKAHTWEQERAAVVAYCLNSGEFSYADSIESGDHWPEGDKG